MKLAISPVTHTENPHAYYLGDKQLDGLTSTIITWLFPSTYAGVPEEALEKAKERGSAIHKEIERCDKEKTTITLSQEVADYMRLRTELELKPVANEYIVSDEKRIASAIDNVLVKGRTIVLADTKCTSEVHRKNVTAQLSVLRLLFHLQNPRVKVSDIGYCAWLPREQYGKPKFIELPLLDYDTTQLVLDAYYAGYDAEPYRQLFDQQVTLPAEYNDMVYAIAEIEQTAKAMAERKKQLSGALLDYFRAHRITSFKSERVDITYVAPTTREAVDTRLLKSEMPEIYNQYRKVSEVADSIRIRVK